MPGLSEELEGFIAETEEGLARLDEDVLLLGQALPGAEVMARAFRVLHTIKGTSSFLELPKIERLGHAGENLLAMVRDGTIELDRDRAGLLFRAIDCLREMLAVVREHGNDEPARDPVGLIEALRAAVESAKAGVSAQAKGAASAAASSSATDAVAAAAAAIEAAAGPGVAGAAERAALEKAAASGISETSIRVDIWRLDRFMNAVGELMLLRNQILARVAESQHPTPESLQQLSAAATRLHDSAMLVRMQPIGRLWRNLPRVVRDLASSLGKEATLVMEGSDTELDRAVIETIRDPLVHAVRNSLDHGIERPEQREQAGKPRCGELRLRAWHAGGQVHVAVEDDGAGIDFERVRRKGVERGLLDPARAAAAGEQELVDLLFRPGFSTADQVSKVSGRGVGMDVVRSALQRVGGAVQLSTRPGGGSRLVMSMPLTLAIISALVVRAAGERYAIAQTSIEEVVRVAEFESFHGLPVFRLRGRLVPLIDLGQVLERRPARQPSPRTIAVVVRGDSRSYGLAVDEVFDMQEIVVKPLPKWLRGPRSYAGLTILGDGSVAVMVDTGALGRRGQVASAAAEPSDGAPATDASAAERQDESVLVIGDGSGGRQALPMRHVLRVEHLPRGSVQQLDGRPALSYRGSVLHIAALTPSAARLDPLNVVVTRLEQHRVGVLVDEVIDIMSAAPCEGSTRAGFPVVLAGGQLTALRDVAQLFAEAGAQPTAAQLAAAAAAAAPPPRAGRAAPQGRPA